jgi:hypothetical protein
MLRKVTVCGLSKDCFDSDGCPDRDWWCCYQVGTPIIWKDDDREKRVEVSWDDSRPWAEHKNISIIISIQKSQQ